MSSADISALRLFEVGPRDGLQNEKVALPVALKINFIQRLRACGLHEIEIASFVKPDQVPAMSGSLEVCQHLVKALGPAGLWVLVPNLKGLELAVGAGIEQVAFFTSASETFNQKNINTSVAASLNNVEQLMNRSQQLGLKTRLYFSMVFGCPYEGLNVVEKTFSLLERVAPWPVDEFSFGDTIGIATPQSVERVIAHLKSTSWALERTAMHFHDTRGAALANVYRAYQLGIRSFDSSAAGLGGCPFARGATGNVATEDIALFCEGEKLHTGIADLQALAAASEDVLTALGRPSASKARTYLLANR